MGQMKSFQKDLIYDFINFMQELPYQFNYQKLKPRGWYTNYRDYPISPQSSNNVWAPNDIVRFLLTNTEGVMDPYRSYFQIQVTTNAQLLPVGGLYIDSSAQSFFSQTVITSQGRQVERIQGYNLLASYLNDVNFSEYICQTRQMQGMGFSNYTYNDAHSGISGGPGCTPVVYTYSPNSEPMCQMVPTGISPISARGMVSQGSSLLPQGQYLSGLQNSSVMSSTNWLWQGVNAYQPNDAWMRSNSMGANLRAQYKNALLNNTTPDSTTSCVSNAFSLPFIGQQMNADQSLTYNMIGYNPHIPYQPAVFNSVNANLYINGNQTAITYPNNGPATGYTNLMSPATSKGAFTPMISPTIPQCSVQNGNILPYKVPVSTKVFRFPLISSIVGVLIMPDQFALLPMKALQQLLLQITLNPFAMVSTGYSDVTQFDQVGCNIPIRRNFVISRILWHLDLYLLYQKQNKAYILDSLSKQIYIGATGWSLGSQYQIPNGQLLNNAWPTSSTAQFMNQVIMMLIPNQYQILPFCKQTTRFSGNITSYQIRFNSQFFPPQPITGNAGNPEVLDSTGDNSLFYLQILKSLDYLFNTNYPHPRINRWNFAINNRCYNPYKMGSYLPPAIYNNPLLTAWTSSGVNGDTAMGLPYIHEQRYQGKAVYVYTWQPYGHSKGMVHGINANLARPFQLILNCSPQGYYAKDQTMYIFIRYAKVVKYSNEGVSVIGI